LEHKCPHCKKPLGNIEDALRLAEKSIFRVAIFVRCQHCDKMMTVRIKRVVQVGSITKSGVPWTQRDIG